MEDIDKTKEQLIAELAELRKQLSLCETNILDFNEQNRLKEELKAQREWFRVTLSSIDDAVIATDINCPTGTTFFVRFKA